MRLYSVVAAAALLTTSLAAHADSVSYRTVNLGAGPLPDTATTGAGSYNARTGITSLTVQDFFTNNTGKTLNNVYLFVDDFNLGGSVFTLTAPGVYTGSTVATTRGTFITASQIDFSFDAASAGSPSTPEIPGLELASSLAPGQVARLSFVINLQGNYSTSTFNSVFTPVTAVQIAPPASAITPEPSSIALLGTGLLGVLGVLRKSFA